MKTTGLMKTDALMKTVKSSIGYKSGLEVDNKTQQNFMSTIEKTTMEGRAKF